VQRLIDLFRQQAIGFNREEHIGGFYADFKLIEVETIEMIDMAHCRFQQRLGRFTVFSWRSFSREPAFTPIRIGIFLSRAQSTTMRIRSSLPILPGLMQAINAVFRYLQAMR
jgi:hypothetical protein